MIVFTRADSIRDTFIILNLREIMPIGQKRTIVLFMGSPGSGKTTYEKELQKNFICFSADKDKYASCLKVNQAFSGIPKRWQAELNQDSIYECILGTLLDDKGSFEKIRTIQGNFAERFVDGRLNINLLLDNFNVCIVHLICDAEVQYNRVCERSKIEGINSSADKKRIAPRKFKEERDKRLTCEENFIQKLRASTNVNYIKIDNSDDLKSQDNINKMLSFVTKSMLPVAAPLTFSKYPRSSNTPSPQREQSVYQAASPPVEVLNSSPITPPPGEAYHSMLNATAVWPNIDPAKEQPTTILSLLQEQKKPDTTEQKRMPESLRSLLLRKPS